MSRRTMTKTQAQRRNHVERTPVPREKRVGFGRPTKYEEAVTIATAKRLIEAGYTDAEIAIELGVTRQTLWNWAQDHPDFLDTFKNAKDGPNNRVKQSLFQRAVGYTVIEERLHQGQIVPIRVHVAADVGAAKHWLGNRDRENWRNTDEVQIVVPEGSAVEPEDANTRTLALAALALFGDAVDAPAIEHRSITEETDDGEDAAQSGYQGQPVSEGYGVRAQARRSRRAPRASAGDSDFDF